MPPITADMGDKDYVVGKGRVFFDQFLPGTRTGTGERFMGNAPELNTNQSKTSLDHYSSTGGVAVKDASVDIQVNRAGSIIVDHISKENLALWFQGSSQNLVVASGTAVTFQIPASKKGMNFQIGTSSAQPSGARKITNLVVKVGASPTGVTMAGNYEADLDLGRIYIEPDAPDIPDGSVLNITYDQTAHTRDFVVSSNQSIFGALRFIADNPTGTNRDVYYPYVKLSPDGDYAVVGENWQQIGFTLDVLMKDSVTEAAYIDGRPVTA